MKVFPNMAGLVPADVPKLVENRIIPYSELQLPEIKIPSSELSGVQTSETVAFRVLEKLPQGYSLDFQGTRITAESSGELPVGMTLEAKVLRTAKEILLQVSSPIEAQSDGSQHYITPANSLRNPSTWKNLPMDVDPTVHQRLFSAKALPETTPWVKGVESLPVPVSQQQRSENGPTQISIPSLPPSGTDQTAQSTQVPPSFSTKIFPSGNITPPLPLSMDLLPAEKPSALGTPLAFIPIENFKNPESIPKGSVQMGSHVETYLLDQQKIPVEPGGVLHTRVITVTSDTTILGTQDKLLLVKAPLLLSSSEELSFHFQSGDDQHPWLMKPDSPLQLNVMAPKAEDSAAGNNLLEAFRTAQSLSEKTRIFPVPASRETIPSFDPSGSFSRLINTMQEFQLLDSSQLRFLEPEATPMETVAQLRLSAEIRKELLGESRPPSSLSYTSGIVSIGKRPLQVTPEEVLSAKVIGVTAETTIIEVKGAQLLLNVPLKLQPGDSLLFHASLENSKLILESLSNIPRAENAPPGKISTAGVYLPLPDDKVGYKTLPGMQPIPESTQVLMAKPYQEQGAEKIPLHQTTPSSLFTGMDRLPSASNVPSPLSANNLFAGDIQPSYSTTLSPMVTEKPSPSGSPFAYIPVEFFANAAAVVRENAASTSPVEAYFLDRQKIPVETGTDLRAQVVTVTSDTTILKVQDQLIMVKAPLLPPSTGELSFRIRQGDAQHPLLMEPANQLIFRNDTQRIKDASIISQPFNSSPPAQDISGQVSISPSSPPNEPDTGSDSSNALSRLINTMKEFHLLDSKQQRFYESQSIPTETIAKLQLPPTKELSASKSLGTTTPSSVDVVLFGKRSLQLTPGEIFTAKVIGITADTTIVEAKGSQLLLQIPLDLHPGDSLLFRSSMQGSEPFLEPLSQIPIRSESGISPLAGKMSSPVPIPDSRASLLPTATLLPPTVFADSTKMPGVPLGVIRLSAHDSPQVEVSSPIHRMTLPIEAFSTESEIPLWKIGEKTSMEVTDVRADRTTVSIKGSSIQLIMPPLWEAKSVLQVRVAQLFPQAGLEVFSQPSALSSIQKESLPHPAFDPGIRQTMQNTENTPAHRLGVLQVPSQSHPEEGYIPGTTAASNQASSSSATVPSIKPFVNSGPIPVNEVLSGAVTSVPSINDLPLQGQNAQPPTRSWKTVPVIGSLPPNLSPESVYSAIVNDSSMGISFLQVNGHQIAVESPDLTPGQLLHVRRNQTGQVSSLQLTIPETTNPVNPKTLPFVIASSRSASERFPSTGSGDFGQLNLGQTLHAIVYRQTQPDKYLIGYKNQLHEIQSTETLRPGSELELRVENHTADNHVFRLVRQSMSMEELAESLLHARQPQNPSQAQSLADLRTEMNLASRLLLHDSQTTKQMGKLETLLSGFFPQEGLPKAENLASFLRDGGMNYEARLAQSLHQPESLRKLVETDLKGQLLNTLQFLQEESGQIPLQRLASAVKQNLQWIETQQLNTYLSQVNDTPYQWDIPYTVGGQMKTMHLSVQPDTSSKHQNEQTTQRSVAGHKVLFLLDLETFGQTRIDSYITPHSVDATLYIENKDAIKHLRPRLGDFQQRLQALGYGNTHLDVRPFHGTMREKRPDFHNSQPVNDLESDATPHLFRRQI